MKNPVVGNSREREMIAVGPSYPGAGASGLDAVSLIEGYAASRGLPNVLDPNTPGDADDAEGIAPENWMAAEFKISRQTIFGVYRGKGFGNPPYLRTRREKEQRKGVQDDRLSGSP